MREFKFNIEHLPEGRCQVKSLTTRDLLILQKSREHKVQFLQGHTDDADLKAALPELSDQYLNILSHLVLGSEDYCGVDGGDNQRPLDAWIANEKPDAEGAPYWFVPVYMAIRDDGYLSEDEAKN